MTSGSSVKLQTDQNGLTGLGEGSVTGKAQTIAAAIEEHERFLVGQDPLRIEWLWQAMYRYPRWRGGPVLNSAISAIEMALWDIKGKAMAEATFLEVALHGASSEVLTAANFHVDATTPNCTIQEHPLGSPWRYELVRTSHRIERGFALLPEAPGLGVELNEAEAARHPYVADFRQHYTFEDGSVADA